MQKPSEALKEKILKFIQIHSSDEALPDEEGFNALALEIFKFQYKQNRFYQKFCALERKSPVNVRHWKDIPAVPVDAFKQFDVVSFPKNKAVRVFKTSGTTAKIRGRHYFQTLSLYDAAIVYPFKKYLLPDNRHCRFFFLTASPLEDKESSLSYMMGFVNKLFSEPAPGKFYIGRQKENFQKLAEDLKFCKNPAMILSTAFSLIAFLDYLKTTKTMLKLLRGSRLMETGGFKGRVSEVKKKDLYALCRKYLGIAEIFCISEYGMTELSSQYYDSKLYDTVFGIKRRSAKMGPAWLRPLIVDNAGREVKNGKKGMLRHVDLANLGSVIAIQTQDIAVKYKHGFEIIGRATDAELRGCSLTYEKFLKQ